MKVLCDRFLNGCTVLPISLSKVILPKRYPPATELLDIRQIQISNAIEMVIENNRGIDFDRNFLEISFEILFNKKSIKEFNSIQSQTISAIFGSNENVFLGAPCGSGKTAMIELALVRALAQNKNAKCVYVTPIEAINKRAFFNWSKNFGQKLGKQVVILTGDATIDLELVKNSSIIISCPEHWDNISRRWKQRKGKVIRNIDLFIADDLHLMSNLQRPTFEIIVSRMRFINSTLDNHNIRFLGISSPVANANDLAGWLGVADEKKSLFNFHPSSRPNRLEIELRGFGENHYGTRMLAMARPCFDTIVKEISNSSISKLKTIVFVPSKRQAKVTAIDLITFAASQQVIERGNESINPDLMYFGGNKLDQVNLNTAIQNTQDETLKTVLAQGVGYLFDGMDTSDRALVESCYLTGSIKVLVITNSEVWGLDLSANLVIIMGTSKFDPSFGTYVDYPITDIMQLIGRSSTYNYISKCVIMCHSKRKAFIKKFLHDPLPVESHLNLDIADPLNAEIAIGVIKNKQDAVDYLTWTFFYRRLKKNPNYYNLLGFSNAMISDFLSELIEDTMNELSESKCIRIEENELDISALNFGMIANHYYIQNTTIKLFAVNLKATSKLRRILDVLVSAEEFENIGVRQNESAILAALAKRLPVPLTQPDFMESRTKVHVLLQLHFSRNKLTTNQKEDLHMILERILKLLQAIIDVVASNSWLNPALAAMELSQMIVQGRWDTDSPLLQIPYFDEETVKRCVENGVKRVFDVAEIDEDKIESVLQLNGAKLARAADFCNNFPDIEVSTKVLDSENVHAGEPVTIQVKLERADDDEEENENDEEEKESEPKKIYGKVISPVFPIPKVESYWLIIGDSENNKIYSIQRTPIGKETIISLKLDAPKHVGDKSLKLYLMCDSYLGFDQVHSISLSIKEGSSSDDSSSGSDSDSSNNDSD